MLHCCDINLGRRCEGGSDNQLRVVSEALTEEFVGTLRLEEDWPGYSWRSALSPEYFLYSCNSIQPSTQVEFWAWSLAVGHSVIAFLVHTRQLPFSMAESDLKFRRVVQQPYRRGTTSIVTW